MPDDTNRDRALDAYAKARPYVYRGAKFAVPAALLSKMYSGGRGAGLITAGAFAAGVGDKALEEAGRVMSLQKKRRLKEMSQSFGKKAGMNTDQDPKKGLFQRNPEALLSSGAEQSNIANTNQMLEDLFSRRDAMAKKSYAQLSSLFTNREHYGRNTRLGMSADEASKLTTRAFKGE